MADETRTPAEVPEPTPAPAEKPKHKVTGIARNLERGLVIVNTGVGKGKSSAAFGVVARAVGQGLKCLIVQFVKGNWRTGEQKAMQMLGVEMYQMGYGFIRVRPTHKTEDEHFAKMQATFEFAQEKAATDAYDLLVLDEACFAMSVGGLDPALVVRWLQEEKPKRLHVILTGRGAPQAIIDAADLVTEMHLLKHYYDRGIGAVRGLEF